MFPLGSMLENSGPGVSLAADHVGSLCWHDQSSRLQKAGQVVSMDPIICTVQAESAPLISSRWEPLQIQAPSKGLMVGAAFQRRAGPGHGESHRTLGDVGFTLFGTGHL